MKFISFLLLGVLVVVILGCFPQEEVLHEIPCGELSLWVGRRVVVTGCLRFECPSFIDVHFHFPEDCHTDLRDESGVAHLGFTQETASLREVLNAYYEESFAKCVFLSAQGRVKEATCPECTPWVFLEVEDLWFPEGNSKKSSLNR